MNTTVFNTKTRHWSFWIGLTLCVLAVCALLLTGIIAGVRNSAGGDSPRKLRHAAFDGDESAVRRILMDHPDWIDAPGEVYKRNRIAVIIEAEIDKFVNPQPSDYDRDYVEGHFLGLEAERATALVHAVVCCRTNDALYLVEHGASVQARLGYGGSLLSHVINTGDTNLLLAFERHGLSYGSPPIFTEGNPILLASWANHPNTLKLLIDRGLSVKVAGREGETPLHVAIDRGRLDFVQLITTNGADLQRKNARGQNSLAFAHVRAKGNSPKHWAINSWLQDYAATNSVNSFLKNG